VTTDLPEQVRFSPCWHERLSALCVPGIYSGTTYVEGLKVLWANQMRVRPARWLNILATSFVTGSNSLVRRWENRHYGPQFLRAEIQPPLFILGHWRSGTTHLHNLLTRDERFAFANLYQVVFPHTFLTTEAFNSRWMAALLPKTRAGLDNVRLAWDVPYEDEFATAALASRSPYLSVLFPRRMDHYDRYLTFRGVPEREIAQWQEALVFFLKKLSWKYKRPLVLKSPAHTCRIRLLLDLFPDARFVHIHRDPPTVFQSTRKMYALASWWWSLQSAKRVNWSERIIRQYREMYDVYFQERKLIPRRRLYELSFEELEADPLGQVRSIYEALDLPDFAAAEPAVREYLKSLWGYRKNNFPELTYELRDRLVHEWNRCFRTWGYAHPLRSGMP
jgi:hypothetical protein